ncbi:MAG TPA: alpha/beta hydrolase [Solirubrobacterales bacterium]|nr:alpha/beta hydrolase [Solirubrobacterales bacterium]
MASDSTASFASADLQEIQASNGITYAFRRVGTSSPDGIPLVLLQHFRGNIDNWDPALVDGLAAECDVIAFDNTGVGGTTGTTPDTAEQMAADAIAFLDALGLDRVDLFGFSLGGFVAQVIALAHPDRVRKLVLASTGPKGAPGMESWPDDVVAALVTPDAPGPEQVMSVFYSDTPASQEAGGAALGRIFGRQEGRDAEVSPEARKTQYYDAVLSWGVRDWDAVERLTEITQPTLIFQGDHDKMIATRASHTLAGLIPDACIVIYPDASHGAIFQYATETVAQTLEFLRA